MVEDQLVEKIRLAVELASDGHNSEALATIEDILHGAEQKLFGMLRLPPPLHGTSIFLLYLNNLSGCCDVYSTFWDLYQGNPQITEWAKDRMDFCLELFDAIYDMQYERLEDLRMSGDEESIQGVLAVAKRLYQSVPDSRKEGCGQLVIDCYHRLMANCWVFGKLILDSYKVAGYYGELLAFAERNNIDLDKR